MLGGLLAWRLAPLARAACGRPPPAPLEKPLEQPIEKLLERPAAEPPGACAPHKRWPRK